MKNDEIEDAFNEGYDSALSDISDMFDEHERTTMTGSHDSEFCMAGIDQVYSSCDKAIVAYEESIGDTVEVVTICIGCGRNASLIWWKCCPTHVQINSPDVYCQSCVEKLHPGEAEFERE